MNKQKCQVCGLFDAARKCLNCGIEVSSAETCVVAYVMGTLQDTVVCINCG